MHFVLGLDIQAVGDRRQAISDHIWLNILSKYKRARRLGNFHIIRINSQDQWQSILNDLTAYSNDQKETIHFIMSPIMTGGRYNGLLKTDDWDFINEITDESKND